MEWKCAAKKIIYYVNDRFFGAPCLREGDEDTGDFPAKFNEVMQSLESALLMSIALSSKRRTRKWHSQLLFLM